VHALWRHVMTMYLQQYSARMPTMCSTVLPTFVNKTRKIVTPLCYSVWWTLSNEELDPTVESMQCPKLQGSKFWPLRIFRHISEEHAALFLRVEQSVNFYQISQDHVPKVFCHHHQNLTSHPQAHLIKASPVIWEFKSAIKHIARCSVYTHTYQQRTHNKATS
jgi:hypothetical protein